MKRKHFLATALAATPALAFGKSLNNAGNTNEPFIVRSGGNRIGRALFFRGKNPSDVLVSGKDTGGALSVLSYIGLEQAGPPLHVHLEQDEIFYVVSGRYRFVAGKEDSVLQAGDTIFLPRNVPHTWLQLSDEGKLIYTLQPAGSFESFLIEMNNLTAPPTPEQAQLMHVKHGMKVLGPPLN